ncbi:MAG: hypothetical protein SXV54_11630, partial [Chloroflexota bacterium]|nr:hypothetical protein [Chloroflexota bacterium]
MFRNPWFWITVTLIAIGIGLTVALGVFYWLVGAFVAAILMLVVTFLIAAHAVGRTQPPQVPRLRKAPHSERV